MTDVKNTWTDSQCFDKSKLYSYEPSEFRKKSAAKTADKHTRKLGNRDECKYRAYDIELKLILINKTHRWFFD